MNAKTTNASVSDGDARVRLTRLIDTHLHFAEPDAMEPMKLLQVQGNSLANLPGDGSFDAQISDCATRQEFEAWSEGNGGDDSLAARFEGEVFVKIPQRSDENGEFSLDYDVLTVDAANARINRWNAGYSN